MASLEACWAAQGPGSALRQALYSSHEEWIELVRQVLRLDIRSLHQRAGTPGKQQDIGSAALHSKSERARVSDKSPTVSGHAQSDSLKHDSSSIPNKKQRQSDLVEEKQKDQASPFGLAGQYRVVLQGITVFYDVLSDRTVLVTGAAPGP